MAPELKGVVVPEREQNTPNGYAADIWALGEITYQMMTSRPSFTNLIILCSYVQNMQTFPLALLEKIGISASGQEFITSTMSASPENRLTASQALNHSWLRDCKPKRIRSPPAASIR